MTTQSNAPNSDERLLAAISHFLGLWAALIVWATHKDKSRFVRFQASQAMALDLVVTAILFVATGMFIMIVFGALALGIADIALLGSQANPSAGPIRTMIAGMTALPFLTACIFTAVGGGILVLRVIATIQTFEGKDFRYPWLGKHVERLLPE